MVAAERDGPGHRQDDGDNTECFRQAPAQKLSQAVREPAPPLDDLATRPSSCRNGAGKGTGCRHVSHPPHCSI